jgi:hypothetical protein
MSLGVFSFGHFRDLPVIILEKEIGLINPYISICLTKIYMELIVSNLQGAILNLQGCKYINIFIYLYIMSLLSFEDIKNGNWYIIPGFYATDTPNRIYKTTYNGNNYIKSIATSNQQEIVQVPANEKIFAEPCNKIRYYKVM